MKLLHLARQLQEDAVRVNPFNSLLGISNFAKCILLMNERICLPSQQKSNIQMSIGKRTVYFYEAMTLQSLLNTFSISVKIQNIDESIAFACNYLTEPPTNKISIIESIKSTLPAYAVIRESGATPLLSTPYGTISFKNKIFCELFKEERKWTHIIPNYTDAQSQHIFPRNFDEDIIVRHIENDQYIVEKKIKSSKMKTPIGTYVFDPVTLKMDISVIGEKIAFTSYPYVEEGYKHFFVFAKGDICYNGFDRFDQFKIIRGLYYSITGTNLKKIGLIFNEGVKVLTRGYKTGILTAQRAENLQEYVFDSTRHSVFLEEYVCT